MGKKVTKATKKFASSGQLKKTIQARHKHKQIRKRIEGKRGAKQGKGGTAKEVADASDVTDEEEVIPQKSAKKSKKSMTVDELLDAGFMDSSEGEDGGHDENMIQDDSWDEGAEDDIRDDESFASVDDLDEEGRAHIQELSELAEKDPEFYKYLQENDRELLDFDAGDVGDMESDQEDVDADDTGDRLPVLTTDQIRKWQKALLEQHSLRALRKLLIAFRSAAYMNEEDQVLAWSIDNSSVYRKLVTTALRYTPVILEHHVPYKTLSNGKFKPPTQTPKLKTLQKLILSYFHNVLYIMSQLTDNELLQLAVAESSKLIPYVITSRKTVKLYLKKCLELWSSADDGIRLTSILAIRKLTTASHDSILDHVLKGIYLTFVRSSKSTSAHTLPSINLMKNSASEVFCIDHATTYQHAFGYIRQLAIHLRNSMKVKSKEAYKQVYNWQFVHCIDFWAIVLARACDVRVQAETGGNESDLKPLIYPLVQVSLGAIKLLPTSRCYPFHLHIVRSLIHLTRHTHVYIPLTPYLVPIISSTLNPSSRAKPSTLRPLDFESHIRAPQQYMKTHVYAEGVIEESAFLLAEWLSTPAVQGSIGFPEISVPLIVQLRKSLKNAKKGSGSGLSSGPSSAKEQGFVKALLERIEDSARWIEQKRNVVSFAPSHIRDVEEWEDDLKLKVEDSPLGKYVKVQRKSRENRKKLLDKAQVGDDEILED